MIKYTHYLGLISLFSCISLNGMEQKEKKRASDIQLEKNTNKKSTTQAEKGVELLIGGQISLEIAGDNRTNGTEKLENHLEKSENNRALLQNTEAANLPSSLILSKTELMALFEKGYAYQHGTQKQNIDLLKAVQCYSKPALQNEFLDIQAHACANLGSITLELQSTEKNLNMAVDYFEKAGAQDEDKAAKAISCYLAGAVCKKLSDFTRARLFFEKAAEQAIRDIYHAKACYNLGILYRFGKGGEIDLKKSCELFKSVANHKHACLQIRKSAVQNVSEIEQQTQIETGPAKS